MSRVIAIGPREQDFEHTNDFFCGSITLYGSNQGKNISYSGNCEYRINHNVFSEKQGEFVENEMLKKLKADPNVQFMSYDPNQAYDCDKEIVERTLCLNDRELMRKLNYKISFRKWAKDVCRIHHSDLLYGKECGYYKLQEKYKSYNAFVVQANFATGGEGTYILTAENTDIFEQQINNNEQYLVSGYEYYNIPINIHAIIYEDDILIFPVSIQIMQIHDNKLLYHGADFLEAMRIDRSVLEEFKQYMKNICAKLQKEGFRGITGVDGMIVDGKVYILEMNNRFQGSTPLLNLALNEIGLPSMQELNYDSFRNKKARYDVKNLKVPYSCFTYLADKNGKPNKGHNRNWVEEKNIVEIYDDGLNYSYGIAPYATLERVVFRTNIVSISSENKVIIHPNIPDISNEWYNEITKKKNMLYLKIALINQGVVLKEDAKQYLLNNGGMREGVYNAVDIFMENIVVNSAVKVKFTALSPFNIRASVNSLMLYCCDTKIGDVVIQKADILGEQVTSSGTKVKDICLLATDRVRIQHATNCYFKHCEVGCEFCEVENHEFVFGMQDILEAVDMYIESSYDFRHFLIGGRTGIPEKESDEIIEIANHISKQGDWPIYVMCIPPRKKKVLKQFYDAHVTEIAFNLEIWDRTLARKWMPGKGAIPRERYIEMLEYATELWGKKGNVRSSFIVGLESEETLMDGIREVCKCGVAPILSVFRPIPGTEGEDFTPLSNDELLSIYLKAQNICDEYELELGPECVFCQNNTLSIPHELL